MSGKIILVTGGTRSGKSTFAEQYVTQAGGKVAYIATAQAADEEMRFRVALHRRRRPAAWQTFEAPYDADRVLAGAVQTADQVLFDCLTIYVSNLLLAMDEQLTDREERCRQVLAQIDKLIVRAKSGPATVVFVTNEAGMGIVPNNPLAREYRDIAGLVNQKVAAGADEVYLVICGLAVELKKLALNLAAGGVAVSRSRGQ